MSIFNDFRPQNFSEIIGQDNNISILKKIIKDDKRVNTFIFYGSRGTGKTTTGRLLARMYNCTSPKKDIEPCNECVNCKLSIDGGHPDIFEIDGASNRGIDDSRKIKEISEFKPRKGIKKIFIIDECHMLTKEAWNSLLKLLEEPPSYCIFILCTTEVYKVIDTIFSRCYKVEFKKINNKDIKDTLYNIIERYKTLYKKDVEIDSDIIDIMIDYSNGSLRDALVALEKAIDAKESGKVDMNSLFDMVSVDNMNIFLNIFKNKDASAFLTFLDQMSGTYTLEKIRISLMRYFKDLFVKKIKDKEDIGIDITYLRTILDTLINIGFLGSDYQYRVKFEIKLLNLFMD